MNSHATTPFTARRSLLPAAALVAGLSLLFTQSTATLAAANPPKSASPSATPLVVTNTANSGAGSLRQAILDSNAGLGNGTITFNIPANGVVTILPTSSLPSITHPVTIDATTQSGWQGKPRVVLSGANAGFAGGLDITSGGSTVKGLAISGFQNWAIDLDGGSGNNIYNCYLGTDADGRVDVGNGSGIIINNSYSNHIGEDPTTNPGLGNVISGNEYGVVIQGNVGDNIIAGNYIGTNAAGTGPLGNTYAGVRIYGGSPGNNISRNIIGANAYGIELDGYGSDKARNGSVTYNYIGTDATGTRDLGNSAYGISAPNAAYFDIIGNTIAFNESAGVEIGGTSTEGIHLSQNSIYSNDSSLYGLGIDLKGDGVTANDAGDTDTGPNALQNFPLITSANTSGGNTVVQGTLNSEPSADYFVELYGNTVCDASGYGEGRTYLGSVQVHTGADGNTAFNLSVAAQPAGSYITALASNYDQIGVSGNTSEFSPCYTVAAPATATSTATKTATNTPVNTATATKTSVSNATNTPTASKTIASNSTNTATATKTAISGSTSTPTRTATSSGSTATSTTVKSGTSTSVPASSATTTPTQVTGCAIQFTDVPASNSFYPYVRCLACRGVLGGYSDPSRCPNGQAPCFRPGDSITRGQMAKVVSNAAGFAEGHQEQSFKDVPASHPFYIYIQRLASRGVVGGYSDPSRCPNGQAPCFLPDAQVTRGQMSKFVALAAGFGETLPANKQTFSDVFPTDPFWQYVERLSSRGVVGGYTCGGPGESCDGQARPYFRQLAFVTRGQASKFVSLAFFPNCQTP